MLDKYILICKRDFTNLYPSAADFFSEWDREFIDILSISNLFRMKWFWIVDGGMSYDVIHITYVCDIQKQHMWTTVRFHEKINDYIWLTSTSTSHFKKRNQFQLAVTSSIIRCYVMRSYHGIHNVFQIHGASREFAKGVIDDTFKFLMYP